ncbi:hypothetical protein V1478_013596, partial [Vespula squamosa]
DKRTSLPLRDQKKKLLSVSANSEDSCFKEFLYFEGILKMFQGSPRPIFCLASTSGADSGGGGGGVGRGGDGGERGGGDIARKKRAADTTRSKNEIAMIGVGSEVEEKPSAEISCIYCIKR